MKTILLKALQVIVRSLIGALNYERIYQAVLILADEAITGEQKKQIILKESAAVIETAGLRDFLIPAIHFFTPTRFLIGR